ncbi:MAG: glutamate cyclase domain-containing protein [Candidatus Methylomirabilales bacterium]
MRRRVLGGAARLGEATDQICLIPWIIPEGDAHRLYRAARRLQKVPLTFLAASRLAEVVCSGDAILLLTGAGAAPELPCGETDGPLGVAVLARALHLGLGARPFLISEERNLRPLQSVLGIIGADYPLLPFPCGQDVAGYRLLEELQPRAVISVEKLGPNSKGVIHDMRGRDVSASHASVRGLFDGARDQGILAVGIGDRGNEVGFGLLFGLHSRPSLRTGRCRCPCRGSIACDIRADVLVVSSISNWGAYGVVRCLQALTGRRLLHAPDDEQAMLQAALHGGARDGVSYAATLTVDGADLAVQQAVVTLLGSV